MDTKQCDKCLKDIPKKAKKCSHCGSKQKGQYGSVSLILGLVILFSVTGMFSSSYGSPSSVQQQSTLPNINVKINVLELLSYRCYKEYGYFHITGEIKNISGKSIESVVAVGSAYTSDSEFVKSSDALIDYNPILANQTSPFEVLMTGNPAISKCQVDFKEFFGGSIPTKRN